MIGGEHFAVHSDHLNTPRKLSDKNGQPRWQWAYSGFGEIGAQSLTTATLSEVRYNLRYPGQVDDGNGNGLFYNGHRFNIPSAEMRATHFDQKAASFSPASYRVSRPMRSRMSSAVQGSMRAPQRLSR